MADVIVRPEGRATDTRVAAITIRFDDPAVGPPSVELAVTYEVLLGNGEVYAVRTVGMPVSAGEGATITHLIQAMGRPANPTGTMGALRQAGRAMALEKLPDEVPERRDGPPA